MLHAFITVLALLAIHGQTATQHFDEDDDAQDSAAYIQAVARASSNATVRTLPDCEVDDHVKCPDSNTICHGEQCCPPVNGGQSYPCPSAPEHWGSGHCQTSDQKKEDCLPSGSRRRKPVCNVGDTVQCADGNHLHMCHGEQCCPGMDSLGSYPCPSAPEHFGPGHCQFPTKKRNCLKPNIRDTCAYRVDVHRNSTDHAIEHFKTMFPHNADMIHTYRDRISTAVINKTCPPDDGPMRNETYPAVPPQPMRKSAPGKMSDCDQKTVTAIIDSVGFAMQVIGGAGIRAALNKDDALALEVYNKYREAGEAEMTMMQKLMKDLGDDLSNKRWKDGAKGVWKLVTELHNKITLSTFFTALQKDMSWWEWVITGIAIVAQIIAWSFTDGIAAAAELVIDIASAGFLVSDFFSAGHACNW